MSRASLPLLLWCVIATLALLAITSSSTTMVLAQTTSTTAVNFNNSNSTEAPGLRNAVAKPLRMSLYIADPETFSSTVAMSIAAGMVSGLSGNPISVMFVLRTSWSLALCFPPVPERVSVMTFPFWLQVGTEPALSYYVGAAIINVAGLVIFVLLIVLLAAIMANSKQYGMDRALHNLSFPAFLFPVIILLGGPSCYCAAVIATNAKDLLNVTFGLISLFFWGMLVVMMPMLLAKVFAAEYVVTMNVQSEEQDKLLALTGAMSDNGSDGTDRGSGSDDDSVGGGGGKGKRGGGDDGEEEGGFSSFFAKLRGGLEEMRNDTADGLKREHASRPKAVEDDDKGMFTRDELDQQEEDMKALAGSTVDVLREMFHHVARTGGDEEKLLKALLGTGEWRDAKTDADYLDNEDANGADKEEEEEKEDEEDADLDDRQREAKRRKREQEEEKKRKANEPISFLKRYGAFFEQYNRKNRFYGFVELGATYLSCAVAGLWFFTAERANCVLQTTTFLLIQIGMWMLLHKRRPFNARMNHGYSQVLIIMCVCASVSFCIAAIFDVPAAALFGYIIGICAVYLNAFRALLDLYLVVVAHISLSRSSWPAIQQLTDIFLAAKDRRDRGQMMTALEQTNDKASARSGKSATSTMSKRQTRFSQKFGTNGMQLFFKMANDSDRFCGSRAIPEEYHPFFMRPLPDQIVLVTEQRRAQIREKMEKAAAKAKWEATVKAMALEAEMEQSRVTAAEAFATDNFDEEEEEKKRTEALRRQQEEKTVPKLVRDLFHMGLQTKFEELDKKEMEMTKIDDLLFPTEVPRHLRLKDLQSAASAARKMAALKRAAEKAKEGKKDENENGNGAKEAAKVRTSDELAEAADEAFAEWVKPDAATQAALEMDAERRRCEQEAAAELGAAPTAFRRSRSATMDARKAAIARAKAEKEKGKLDQFSGYRTNDSSKPSAAAAGGAGAGDFDDFL